MSERRAARLLVGLLLACVFGPILLRGHVLYPHSNAGEVGLPEPDDGRLSSRKFSDESHYYVPELASNLGNESPAWITGWNPHAELGRPSVQVYGLGRAFLLTRILSFFTTDPLWVYTLSSVLASVLCALFAFLLLEALGLRPAACAVGSLGFTFGVYAALNQLFTLFLWGVCWTTALAWMLVLIVRRTTWPRVFALAFFAHALLVTAYPQHVVWYGYLLSGYGIFLLARHAERWRKLAAIGAALALGAVTALPLLLDLLHMSSSSVRLESPMDFFRLALPKIESFQDAALIGAILFDPLLFGNPLEASYPSRYASVGLTPLCVTLAAIACVYAPWRRLWPLYLFALFLVAFSFWVELYELGVRHLGLHFSRTLPLRFLNLPVTVLAAIGADRVLRGAPASQTKRIAATVAGALLAAVAIAFAFASGQELSTYALAVALLLAGGAIAFLWTRRSIVLLVLAAISAFHYGGHLQLHRPPDEIHETSPLVEAVRARTADGSRYAWVQHGIFGHEHETGTIRVLASNQEAFLGLKSIHTYNPLSSPAYQRWAFRLRRDELRRNLGRRFSDVKFLGPLHEPEFQLAGVGVLLSPKELAIPGWRAAERVGPVVVHEPATDPLLEAQFPAFERLADGGARPRSLDPADRLAVERTLDQGDLLHFHTTPTDATSLLFVSQQFHDFWRATTAQGTALETLRVNDLYLGVLVPPRTEEIELRFHAHVEWMWLSHLGFVANGLALVVLALRRRLTA